MRFRPVIASAVLVAALLPSHAAAEPSRLLSPPVDGAISRHFEAPASEFGAGHRGIDYSVAAGTRVRAAARGAITFAGVVAGVTAVTIDHGGGMKTTYTRLASTEVAKGQEVTRGEYIGVAGEAHPGVAGLHFGVKVDGDYVDPESLMPVSAAEAIHLVAVDEGTGKSAAVRVCRKPPVVRSNPPPPNGNIAVAIAGIGSRTDDGSTDVIYDPGPAALGYPAGRVYRFSYRGISGPGLHQPYGRRATYQDIRTSALRLSHLLGAISRSHPGTDVDLIAHSQGGVVARTFLELDAGPFSTRLPHVDHIVTFSSPHSGAPLAGAAAGLHSSVVGGLADAGLSLWARGGGPVPDPFSPAVAQLAPGSDLLDSLARHDVTYGTRVLAIGTPTDWMVPADRARWEGKYSRTVTPVLSPNAHSAVVESESALATAYSFLRDAPRACAGGWDTWGPVAGRAVGAIESAIPGAAAAVTP